MIEQLAFEFESTVRFVHNTDRNEIEQPNVNRKISVYVIEDIVSQKKYVGISADPLTRIACHFNGNGSTELYKEIKNRRQDFEYRVLENFIDNDFSPSNTKSVAYHVEALIIAFYDSIRSGYNTKFYINSDFTDEIFWLSILPENFKKFYINSDKEQLNRNIQKYLPSKYVMRLDNFKSPKIDNIAKELYRNYLQSMIDKKIPVYIYAYSLCHINRSQLNRFMRKMNGALRLDRIAFLVKKIEDHLDIAHRFDINKELEYILQSETVS